MRGDRRAGKSGAGKQKVWGQEERGIWKKEGSGRKRDLEERRIWKKEGSGRKRDLEERGIWKKEGSGRKRDLEERGIIRAGEQ